MRDELGFSTGTAIVILIALYFIVKWAVKNGIKDAFEDIIKDDLEEIHGSRHKKD